MVNGIDMAFTIHTIMVFEFIKQRNNGLNLLHMTSVWIICFAQDCKLYFFSDLQNLHHDSAFHISLLDKS